MLDAITQTFVFGPLMLYNSRTVEHKYLRAGLVIAGLVTMAMGGAELLEARRRRLEAEALGRVMRAPGLEELERASVNVPRRRRFC